MNRAAQSIAFAVALVAAVALGSGLALRTPSGEPSGPRPPEPAPHATPRAAPSTASTLSIQTTWTSLDAWGAKQPKDLPGMRDAFLGAADLRTVFEDGLRRPEAGGLFYAQQVVRRCGFLRNSTAEAGSALARAQARCATLGDTASRERLDTTLQTATRRLDPAMAIVDRLDEKLKATTLSPADVGTALDAAIAVGDPYVLRTVLLRGVPRLERFDGQSIDAELRGNLMMASRLALCDLGLDCAQDARVLLSCSRPDGCADPLAAMGVGDSSMSDDRRRALTVLANRIAVAARDGTLSRLVQ